VDIFDQLEDMLNLKIRHEQYALEETERQISTCEDMIQNLVEESRLNPSNAQLRERRQFGVVSIVCKTNPSFNGTLDYTFGANKKKQLQFSNGEAREDQ